MANRKKISPLRNGELYDSQQIAIQTLKNLCNENATPKPNDGEIILCRYKDDENVKVIMGLFSVNQTGAMEVTILSDNSNIEIINLN